MLIPRALASDLVGVVLVGLAGCATAPASREGDPAFARQNVAYATHEPPGTIVIDPASHFLYLVQGGGKATRYGVGVGAEGFAGLAGRPFTPNRNGRTGIRQRKFCRGSHSSESIWCNCKAALE